MRTAKIKEGKVCPICGKTENQIKIGYHRSETQCCNCKERGTYYTMNPKPHTYPKEIREQAIKMYYGGISARGVGKILHRSQSM